MAPTLYGCGRSVGTIWAGSSDPTKRYPLGGRPETRNGPRRSEGRTPHCYREAGANRRFPPPKGAASAPNPVGSKAHHAHRHTEATA